MKKNKMFNMKSTKDRWIGLRTLRTLRGHPKQKSAATNRHRRRSWNERPPVQPKTNFARLAPSSSASKNAANKISLSVLPPLLPLPVPDDRELLPTSGTRNKCSGLRYNPVSKGEPESELLFVLNLEPR